MSVDLPAGWVVQRSAIVSGSGSVCLAPRSDTQVVFGCAGVALDFGAHLPGSHTDPYAPNVGDGWYPATDVEPCPFVPETPGGTLVGIETKPGFAQGLKPVGAHRADWNRWTASCAGHVFHPQAWYLPASRVVVFDYLGHDQTAAILASAKFAADGDVLPSMPTYVSAHVVSESGSTLVVQPFRTYVNDAAGQAYATAHGLHYPYDDDHVDVDTGAERTVTTGSSTACVGDVVLTQQSAGLPVSCSAFAGHKGLPVGIWVLPGSSVAESVSEIFRP